MSSAPVQKVSWTPGTILLEVVTVNNGPWVISRRATHEHYVVLIANIHVF